MAIGTLTEPLITRGAALSGLLIFASACSSAEPIEPPPPDVEHALYVAHEASLAAYDIATGAERSGALSNLGGPGGMQALADGTLLVNLPSDDQIVAVDARDLREIKRSASSTMGGTTPSDAYISPERGGKAYWLTLNDGSMTAGSSTAVFVDIAPESPTRFQSLGEIALGVGHHQAAFSATRERVVATSFYSCDNVLSIYDYSDVSAIKVIKTIKAGELGFDGSSMAKTCDAAESVGVAMRPLGCATSAATGRVYCNLAGPGVLVVVNIDADTPTWATIPTTGKGGGDVKAGDGGNYIYTVQSEPNEKTGGAKCQVGRLLTIDTSLDSVVAELPLFYNGPDCADALAGTDEASAGPSHITMSLDGTKLFIALAGGLGDAAARVRRHLVVDIREPIVPEQLPSIPVGASTGQRGSAMTADGKLLFVADSADNTVTQIDVETLSVMKTIPVKTKPLRVATFGKDIGPSAQVAPVH